MWEWLSGWSSNPTTVLAAIAVIALFWRGARWTQRMEHGLQTLGERIDGQGRSLEARMDAQAKSLEARMDAQAKSLEARMDAQAKSLEERMDAQAKSLEERIDTGLTTLRDEVRQQQAETRRTLDILLLRVGGGAETAAGSSPLKLTEFRKRIEARLDPAEWIAATAEELLPKTEGLEPFEIDALCDDHVRNRLDIEWQRRVARAVYEFGSDERAVGDVLRILLRDALLARRGTSATPTET